MSDSGEHMMNAAPIRILGLDPGLRRTGWGLISVEGSRLSHVAHGVISPKKNHRFQVHRLICSLTGVMPL